jgi:transposase
LCEVDLVVGKPVAQIRRDVVVGWNPPQADILAESFSRRLVVARIQPHPHVANIAGQDRGGRLPPREISPVALEALARVDAFLEVEHGITGLLVAARLDNRRRLPRSLVENHHDWLLFERAGLSRHASVPETVAYLLDKGRWPVFTHLFDDCRLCLTTMPPSGRCLDWPWAARLGSSPSRSGAAFIYSLIVTAKFNDIDPQAWLANVHARIASTPVSRLTDLLPWNTAPA